MQNNLGYACINMTLRKDDVTTNRKCIKRTFEAKGLPHVSSLVLQNVTDLVKIIQWNHDNDIKAFRMSSNIVPWYSEFEIEDLPDSFQIIDKLQEAGHLATEYGQRLSFHPGQFCVLASPTPDIVDKAIVELNNHAKLMDYMGLSKTPYNKINIHVGGAYGDKAAALERFCNNFKRLQPSAKARLTVENDDKGNMYSVKDLYYGVYGIIGIPIVFDYHHHQFCTGELSEREALELALKTWPDNIKPMTHYSEGRDIEYAMRGIDEKVIPQAHSDYIYNEIQTYGHSFDIMVESKAKELTLQKYRENTLTSQKDLLYS